MLCQGATQVCKKWRHVCTQTIVQNVSLGWSCRRARDASLSAMFAKFGGVRNLELANCRGLTDGGLASIMQFTQLNSLSITCCPQFTVRHVGTMGLRVEPTFSCVCVCVCV